MFADKGRVDFPLTMTYMCSIDQLYRIVQGPDSHTLGQGSILYLYRTAIYHRQYLLWKELLKCRPAAGVNQVQTSLAAPRSCRALSSLRHVRQSDENLMISSFVAIDSRVNGLHCGHLLDTEQISQPPSDENARDQ